jgi:hypothetical protein
VGKTTLARVLAVETGLKFSALSAVTSGKKEMQDIISRASRDIKNGSKRHLLFIDEIHCCNKAQQDGLLHGGRWYHYFDRRHHRKSFVRSNRAAAIPMSGIQTRRAQ